MREFNFILQNAGLQHLKPKFYLPGKPLSQNSSDMSQSNMKDLADLDYSMSTMENGKHPVSMLGTPVFCDMILESADGKLKLQLLWVLADVSMQKNIVKTAIQGRSGTVKEYISDGDHEVKLRGGLFSQFSNAYPKEDVLKLRQLLKIGESLKVTSEYLQLFDIYELTVEDYNIPQHEAMQNVQLFNISVSEDKPIQLLRSA